MKTIQLIVLLCIAQSILVAQNYFSNDYSEDTKGIRLTTLAVATDGSYYASGNTFNTTTSVSTALLIKCNANGAILWQKSFDQMPNGVIHDIKINKDGDLVAVFKHTTGFGTMKISASGAVLWSKLYTSTTDPYFASAPYTKYSLTISADNQLFVNTSQFTSGSVLYRISDDDGNGDGDHDGDDDEDNDGDNNDDGGDIDTTIVIDDSGSVGKIPTMCMTICDDDSSVIVVGKDNDDCFAFRVGMNGNVIWSKVYDDRTTTNYIRMKSIINLHDGNYMMVGLFSPTYGSQYESGIVIKINKNGDILWSKTYSETAGLRKMDFEKVIQLDNNRLFIIGSDLEPSDYTYHPFMMEIAANGDVIGASYLSNRAITGVTFPTAYIDAAADKNNIIGLSTYISTTNAVSYINKTDNITHITCNPNSLAISATTYDMASLPTRPLTNIHANTYTIDVAALTNTATDMDINLTSNCRLGSFEVANSINSEINASVSVYPNPTVNTLMIQADNMNDATFKVYDMNGHLMMQSLLQDNEVSVKNLASGSYVFVINTNEQTFKGKFVKE